MPMRKNPSPWVAPLMLVLGVLLGIVLAALALGSTWLFNFVYWSFAPGH